MKISLLLTLCNLSTGYLLPQRLFSRHGPKTESAKSIALPGTRLKQLARRGGVGGLAAGGGRFGALASVSRERNDFREIWLLALPALVSELVDPFLSVVDTAYCGRLGPAALASLGPCVSLFHLSFNMFGSIRGTTTALISSALAQSEADLESDPINIKGKALAADIALQSLCLSVVVGCGISLLLLTQGHHALRAMGLASTSPLFKPAHSYLRVRALASPAFLSIMAMEGIFRGYGDTRGPLLAVLAAAVANLVLDPLLIFQPFNLGLAGAAFATAAAQYAAAGVFVTLLWCRRGKIRIGKLSRLVRSMREEIFGAATPTTSTMSIRDPQSSLSSHSTSSMPSSSSLPSSSPLSSSSSWSSSPLSSFKHIASANGALLVRTMSLMLCWASASAVATRMGPLHAAAHQVTLSVWLTLSLIGEAPSVSGQILAARCVGAKQYARLRLLTLKLVGVNLAVGCGLGLALRFGLSSWLIGFMGHGEPVLQSLLKQTLPIVSLQLPLVTSTLALESVLVGCSHFRWLGASMLASTALASKILTSASTAGQARGVASLWSGGLTWLFVFRFGLAAIRLLDYRHGPLRNGRGGGYDEGDGNF